MEIVNKKWSDEHFYKVRESEVLGQWHTGAGLKIEDGVEYESTQQVRQVTENGFDSLCPGNASSNGRYKKSSKILSHRTYNSNIHSKTDGWSFRT